MENTEKKVAEAWSGEFGNAYTDRNLVKNLDDWNYGYKERFGVTRLDMFREFFGDIQKEARILEVGCNVGYQLIGLKQLGFRNLYGVEINAYALRKAREIEQDISYLQGDVFDLPFKDRYFDLVFFSGLLVLLPPETLDNAIQEIARCTRKYMFGHEYYSDTLTPIPYRGSYIWKMNFVERMLSALPDFKLKKEVRYPYLSEKEQGNVDTVFLIERK